tara:strand:- start:277 stop:471 length:195 start_codon:yes stop_codon:yes gene_type:complete
MNPTDRIVRILKIEVDRLKRRNEDLEKRIKRLETLSENQEKPHDVDIHGRKWEGRPDYDGSENH